MGVYDHEDEDSGWYEDWDGPINLEVGDRVTTDQPWNEYGISGEIVNKGVKDGVEMFVVLWDDGEKSTEPIGHLIPEIDEELAGERLDDSAEIAFSRGDRVFRPNDHPGTVGIVEDIHRSEMGFDVEYTVLWPNGDSTKEYDFTIWLDESDGEDQMFPDVLPWGEEEQQYYRSSWRLADRREDGEPEWDGRDGSDGPARYPWIRWPDGHYVFGPVGGSHEMIWWANGMSWGDNLDDFQFGEVTVGNEGVGVRNFTGILDPDNADYISEEEIKAAFNDQENHMGGTYQDYLDLRHPLQSKVAYVEELEKWVYIRGVGHEQWEDMEFSRTMQNEFYSDPDNWDGDDPVDMDLRGHMTAMAELLGREFTWETATDEDYKMVDSLPSAGGLYNPETNTFSGRFSNGVTPEEVNEAIWDGEAEYDEYDLRDAFGKVSKTEDTFNGWTFISWADETPKREFVQWRYPVMADVDEKKVFIGPAGTLHYTLATLMGANFRDDRGGGGIASLWNTELGKKDWFAGYVTSGGEVLLWGNPDDEPHRVMRDWWIQNKPDNDVESPPDLGAWQSTSNSDIINRMPTETLSTLLADDIAAQTAADALTAAGGQVFIVGGAVRDAVLGSQPKDIDLMCGGLSDEQIEAALAPLGRLDFTGKQFGVFRFKKGDGEVEIALPRTEQSTGTGHKDFSVTADPFLDPVTDLGRRDFTGNAMAYNTATGELLDPYGGADDLRAGRLRLVNENAFVDDPLRIVRALVAQARFGLQPDEELLASMKANAHRIRHLPGERIQMELDKLLAGKTPSEAMSIAGEAGLLDYMAPELASAVGFDQQNPHHDLDVYSHTMQVLTKMSDLTNDPDLRLAALFHDSGKPDSFWRDESLPEGNGGHFYRKIEEDGTEKGADHEEVGAEYVEQFMNRLRYPTKRIERVKTLVANHMFPYFSNPKGARKFLAGLDGDVKMAFDLLNLREADASGKRDGSMSEYDTRMLEKARTLLQEVIDKGNAMTTKDLAVNGRDLLDLGVPQGPEMGQILNGLLDLVIENPELNNRDDLLKVIQDGLR